MLALCLDSKSKNQKKKKKQSARREPVLAQVVCRVFVAVTSRGSDEEMEFLKAISQRQCGGIFGPLPFFAHMSFRAWSDAHFVSHRHKQPVAGNWRFQSDRQARHDSTAAPQRPVVATPQQPSFMHNAVAEIRLLKSAVAALGEDSPHASFFAHNNECCTCEVERSNQCPDRVIREVS